MQNGLWLLCKSSIVSSKCSDSDSDSLICSQRAACRGVNRELGVALVFFLFPAFYLVVLGPSLLRIFRQMVWGGLNP